MPDFGGKVTGLGDLEAALKAIGTEISKKALRSGVRKGGQLIAKDAKTRIHKVSGETAESIRVSVRVDESAGTVTAKIKPGKDRAHIARFLELGTKPHTIKPKNGKALKLNGGTIVDQVEHPGSQPHPFMRPAADTQFPAAVAEVTAATTSAIAKFQKKSRV